ILIILTIDFNWGEINIGNNSLPVTQLVAGIIFIFASITDWLDGYIARKYNLITNMGKSLDQLADKLLVSAAFIMLIELQIARAWIVIVSISREFAITGFRLVASGVGVVLAASSMGKLKTVSQSLAVILLMLNNFPFSYTSIPFDMIMLYIALIFTVCLGLDYLVINYNLIMYSE